jgi:hypothetical protein
MDTDPHKSAWRFFTRPIEEDGAAGHRWCWAQLDVRGHVVASGSDFYTVVAAVRDARTHGFDGPDDPNEADEVLARLGDRRAFDICTS